MVVQLSFEDGVGVTWERNRDTFYKYAHEGARDIMLLGARSSGVVPPGTGSGSAANAGAGAGVAAAASGGDPVV